MSLVLFPPLLLDALVSRASPEQALLAGGLHLQAHKFFYTCHNIYVYIDIYCVLEYVLTRMCSQVVITGKGPLRAQFEVKRTH